MNEDTTPDDDFDEDEALTPEEAAAWDQGEDLNADDVCIRGKWSMDGATTLQEAADLLKHYARYIEDLASQGYELTSPVEDDYGFASHQNPAPKS